MDWEYFIDSNFSNCIKNGVICSCIILMLKSSSREFYKKLNLNRSNNLKKSEIFFLKQYYLFEAFYENFIKQRSIIRNTEIRLHLYILIYLFFNLGVNNLYNHICSSKIKADNTYKFKTLNRSESILQKNILTYGVSGMFFGYLFFGYGKFIMYCGIINTFNGLLYYFTYSYLNRNLTNSRFNLKI
jgi:hypothetical protein